MRIATHSTEPFTRAQAHALLDSALWHLLAMRQHHKRLYGEYGQPEEYEALLDASMTIASLIDRPQRYADDTDQEEARRIAARLIEEQDPAACTQIEWDDDLSAVTEIVLHHGEAQAREEVARRYADDTEAPEPSAVYDLDGTGQDAPDEIEAC